MGQVSVTLNGRTYRLSCGDGEEQHLLGLVALVRGHMDGLVAEHGQVGDDRLLLMTSLLIADELHDVRKAATSPPAITVGRPVGAEALPPLGAADESSRVRPPLPIAGESKPTGAAEPGTKQALASGDLSSLKSDRPEPMPPPDVASTQAQSQKLVTAPLPAVLGPSPATAARAIETMDATALMKGLERKVGRL